MKNLILISFALIYMLSIMGCRKEEVVLGSPIPPVAQTPIDDEVRTFTQLKIGNYWVYQGYYVDIDNNTETLVNYLVDSLYIEKDTMIDNKTYFIQKGTLYGMGAFKRIMRVDLTFNRIVSPTGEIFFKYLPSNMIKTLHFDTLNPDPKIDSVYTSMERTYFEYERSQTYYLNNSYKKTRYKKEVYIKNRGVSKYTTFLENGPIDVHMKLIRYKLN